MSFRAYTFVLLSLIAGFLLAVPAFSLIIDPEDLRGIYGLTPPRYDGFDPTLERLGLRPLRDGNREAKTLNAAWFRPDGLALGSSAVYSGIDPTFTAWEKVGVLKAFNYGLAGANIEEVAAFFKHVETLGKVSVAVVGFDFYMFNANKPPTPDFPLINFAQSPSYKSVLANKIWTRLLSQDYFFRCLDQVGSTPKFLRFFSPAPAAVKPDPFLSRLAYFETHSTPVLYPGGPKGYSFVGKDGKSTFETLRALIDLATKKHTKLYLFITPSNARHYEIIRLMGLWPTFEQWMKQLVAVVDEEARKNPDSSSVELWDFCCYNSITKDSSILPDDSSFVWYLDSIHFKKEVGNFVLDRMFGVTSPSQTMPPDFGVRLTAENIESRLAAIRAEQEVYETCLLYTSPSPRDRS